MITGYQIRWRRPASWYWVTTAQFVTRPEAEACIRDMLGHSPGLVTELFEVELERCNRQLVQFPHAKRPDRVVRMLTLLPGHLVSVPGEPAGDWLYGVAYTEGVWYRVRKPAAPEAAFSAWQTCGVVGVSEVRPPKGANFTRLLQGVLAA